MKRDRDGKSAKSSATRKAVQQETAVVVNDHMYRRPYIILTQNGS